VTITDPTFTYTLKETVGEFVRVDVRITFAGGYIDYLLGAKPIAANLATWAEGQINFYRVS